MKAVLGGYYRWYEPHRWTQLLYKILSEERADKIEDYILGLPGIQRLQSYVTNAQPKEYIRIDPYDVWSADMTMAKIIAPLLIKMKEHSHGYFQVDQKDRRHKCQPDQSAWGYVVDEMIWTFTELAQGADTMRFCHGELKMHSKKYGDRGCCRVYFDKSGYYVDKVGEKWYHDRITNGLRLFGRYYRNLWT